MAAHDLGDRADVVHDARRGLAQRGEDDLDAGVLGQQPVEVGGVEADAPAGLVADEVGAVGLAQLDPALAELAGGAAPAPWCPGGRGWRPRTPSRRSRSPRRRAPGCAWEDVRQAAQHALVQRVEGGRAVVEHRRGHRLRDRGRHRRRASGHEVLLDEGIRRQGAGRVGAERERRSLAADRSRAARRARVLTPPLRCSSRAPARAQVVAELLEVEAGGDQRDQHDRGRDAGDHADPRDPQRRDGLAGAAPAPGTRAARPSSEHPAPDRERQRDEEQRAERDHSRASADERERERPDACGSRPRAAAAAAAGAARAAGGAARRAGARPAAPAAPGATAGASRGWRARRPSRPRSAAALAGVELGVDPVHHRAQLLALALDLVVAPAPRACAGSSPGPARFSAIHSRAKAPDWISPRMSLHRLARRLGDDPLAAREVAVFGRVGDRVAHPGDALLVHQVDDQLELVQALEVRQPRVVAGVDERLVARAARARTRRRRGRPARRRGRSRSRP